MKKSTTLFSRLHIGRLFLLAMTFALLLLSGCNEKKSEPASPDVPDTPVTPDIPDTPVTPDIPDTPVTPDIPDTPVTPDIPDTPENEVQDICGNKYKCVKIGEQVWMAENMRCDKYDTESERAGATLSKSSRYTYAPYYIDGSNATTEYSGNLTSEQRNKLGYLYNWAAAVGLASESAAKNQISSFSGNRQGICPNGWHVPSNTEWDALGVALGGTKDVNGHFQNIGKLLKTTSGWYSDGNGTDEYSFAALPAGIANGSPVHYVGYGAYFCTATPYNIYNAYYRSLSYYYDYLFSDYGSKYDVRSVRCIKN